MLPNQLPASLSKIRKNLIEISGISRANGALIFSMTGMITSEVFIQEVQLEPSEEAKFALSWPNPSDLLALELETPEGEIISLSSASDNVRPIYTDRPYMGYHIKDPIPGTWKMIVKPERFEKGARFDLFVFNQNSRIGGGIIAPRRFFKTGEVITLQFQAYFDRVITGVTVTGFVTLPGTSENVTIRFSDDEQKDPLAGPAGNGLYTGTLSNTDVPGSYGIRVVVESDGSTATYVKSHGPEEEQDEYEYDPIPAFRREYVMTLSVGEERQKRIEVQPLRGNPGDRLQATVKGIFTHFKPGDTLLDFGDGITVSNLQIVNASTASATLVIDRGATLGIRSVIATTKTLNEVVHVPEGFQVVPRQWAWSDKWTIRLLIFIIILLLLALLIMAILLIQGP